jgi:steroid delta-isomerase-like uncharacterized protein
VAIAPNKALVRRFIAALNTDELSVLAEICTAEVAEGWRDGINNAQPWSEHRIEIDKLVAEDDDVMVVLDTRGIVAGEFHGIPPSGKPYRNRGAVYFHIEDGKIAEVATYFDDLNIVTEQLGATITPPA